jgi:anti-sigma-K factor RskA
VGDLEKANRKRQDFWHSLQFWAMMAVLWAEIGASIALAATGRHH